MTVYSFYLFNRDGTCLCYREWQRPKKVLDNFHDQKNMFGMLFALRGFAMKLCQDDAAGIPKYFVTDVYALHYFQTPTGLRFVLTTSRDFRSVNVTKHLAEIYSRVYVEFVVKNPLYIRGTPIKSQLFVDKLDAYIKSLPCF